MARSYVWMGVLAVVGLQLLGPELGSPVAALNCQTAADCGGAPATCELTTYQTCAGKDAACPAGSACGDKPTIPNQPGCAPYVEGICRQAYELPCQVDADCGTGFHCVEQIGMACMGMGSSGGAGVAPSWHEECHVSRGSFACELNKTPCSPASGCASGLLCQKSDTNFCYKSTCALDTDCASGLRCQQSGVSFCWTSFGPPSTPEVAQALDACTEMPPLVCAPRGYFGDEDLNLPNGGVGGSADEAVAGTAGNATHDRAEVDEAAGATGAGEGSAPTGGGGCSLHASARATRTELSWFAFLGLLIFRRHLARRRRPRLSTC